MTRTLDPIFQEQNVHLEPEELLEPESEPPKGRPKMFGKLRVRLSEYGNRVLASGRRLVETASETITNIGTALAGSIILLPLVILVRGVSVLSHSFLDLVKSMLLSILRALFEAMRVILLPFHKIFVGFNKNVLFPAIKRIREDDTAALIAFVVMLVVVGGAIFLTSNLL